MNISYFKEGLEIISSSGHRLSPEQILLIENSLTILQHENKFKDVYFWGRINAIESDYYISFGYTTDCLKDRRYFYSLNCYDWFLLPLAKSKNFEAALCSNTKFTGDSSLVVDVFTEEIFKLKEEDRLSVIVHCITEESALIPRGSVYKRVDDKNVLSKCFRGLSLSESSDPTNYQLYRDPKMNLNQNLLKRHHYNYPTDFYDTMDCIIPDEKSFSRTITENQKVIFMKSLQWPGMIFYHKINSEKHGFIYCGDGFKNMDLLFMI